MQCLTQINNRKGWLKSSIAIADRTVCMKSFMLSWLLREEYFSWLLLHHWQIDGSLVRGRFYSIASLILFHCICCFTLFNNNSWEIFLQACNQMELPYTKNSFLMTCFLMMQAYPCPSWSSLKHSPLWEIWIFYYLQKQCYVIKIDMHCKGEKVDKVVGCLLLFLNYA